MKSVSSQQSYSVMVRFHPSPSPSETPHPLPTSPHPFVQSSIVVITHQRPTSLLRRKIQPQTQMHDKLSLPVRAPRPSQGKQHFLSSPLRHPIVPSALYPPTRLSPPSKLLRKKTPVISLPRRGSSILAR